MFKSLVTNSRLPAVVLSFGAALLVSTRDSAVSPKAASLPEAYGDGKETALVEVQEAYGNLPLYFISNAGQLDRRVRFYEQASNHATFFTEEGIYLSLRHSQPSEVSKDQLTDALLSPNSTIHTPPATLIKLFAIGGNPNASILAEGVQQGKVNYLIGSDPKKWETNLPTYRCIVYEEVYPGIDLRFYGNTRQLEYDIIVKPGADPSRLRIAFEGIKGLTITEDGDLSIDLNEGHLLQSKPIVYQEIGGRRVQVRGKLKIQESMPTPFSPQPTTALAYGVELGAYDKAYPLILDPVLVYSTYLGGSGAEEAHGIALDAAGHAYVTGTTSSLDFPIASKSAFGPWADLFRPRPGGGEDVFVTELNSNGSGLIYSTYLGGTLDDEGRSIAVDAAGNAYVTGGTRSADFPVTSGAFDTSHCGTDDVFVTKLNPLGYAPVYSTFLGTCAFGGGESGFGIAVDATGNAYVTGAATGASDFPITPGAFQTVPAAIITAFVTKFNAKGSALLYSTFLSGSGDLLGGLGRGIAVDATGNAYVIGYTSSSKFPTTAGAFQTKPSVEPCPPTIDPCDAFVAKLNAAGSELVYSTYLGGSGVEVGSGIAVDAAGNAYVTGMTQSADFPTTIGAFDKSLGNSTDAFVTKLHPNGSGLIYSTYLGGSHLDDGSGIAVDATGNAYVTGRTSSPDFPTAGAFQTKLGGARDDAFVTKLKPNGSGLIYSSYLGGSKVESGFAIAVDRAGNAYVTGGTRSVDFPVTASAFNKRLGAPCLDYIITQCEAFVAKVAEIRFPR